MHYHRLMTAKPLSFFFTQKECHPQPSSRLDEWLLRIVMHHSGLKWKKGIFWFFFFWAEGFKQARLAKVFQKHWAFEVMSSTTTCTHIQIALTLCIFCFYLMKICTKWNFYYSSFSKFSKIVAQSLKCTKFDHYFFNRNSMHHLNLT